MDSFSAGLVSGIFQTLIGHPFDTMKTLSQNNTRIRFSPVHLYYGVMPSLFQSGLLCGCQFKIEHETYLLTKNRTLSSLLSGLLTSFIICPLENVKINQQRNQQRNQVSPMYLLRTLRHLPITALREMPFSVVYFHTYETYRAKYGSFIAGSLAGVFSWFVVYPIDTVKSRLQSEQAKTVIEAVGQGFVFKGLGYCLFRGFIVNGVGFYIYDSLLAENHF